MRVVRVLLVLALLGCACAGFGSRFQYMDAYHRLGTLLPIEEGGKFGFIDRKGKVVVAPQFADAENFCEGKAAVAVEKDGGLRYGFIDVSGRFVIEPQFEDAAPFSDGLAAVQVHGAWGFVDEKGVMVIEPRYSEPGFFVEGRASMSADPPPGEYNHCFYIDKSGAMVGPRFLLANHYSEGLAVVRLPGFKYVDGAGKVVIELNQCYVAKDFSEGLAAVIATATLREPLVMKYAYIDKTGKMVITPKYGFAGEFHEGLAAVSADDNGAFALVGFIDRKGKTVIEPRFTGAYGFQDGLAAVTTGSSSDLRLWGYIDRKGKWAIEPRFTYAFDFFDGVAQVSFYVGKECRWGYIDRTGKFIWQGAVNTSRPNFIACSR